ncbi:hypothetical protein B0J17DRAFT_657726 [Rhizoctonia solani]|nr:hypothetical protein B0J17DRAFT_657726 [Rhizoctonia solani]
MASPTVNVVRYTALGGGILYGIFHRRTLQTRLDNERAHEQEASMRTSLVTDPDDPRFDIDKLIAKYEK